MKFLRGAQAILFAFMIALLIVGPSSVVAPAESSTPEITLVDFPSKILADGKENEGHIFFKDAEGDVAKIQFEVVQGDRASLQLKPDWEFDPKVGGQKEGFIPFAISATAGQQVKLRVTLTDKAGNQSQSQELAFDVETMEAPFTICPSGCPFSSVQGAVEAAQSGTTITIGPGTYNENVLITKSVAIRGGDRQQTVIKSREPGKPVIYIASDSEIQVTLHGLTATNAGVGGIQIRGKAKLTLTNSQISENDGGDLNVSDEAQVVGQDVYMAHGWITGSAQVALTNTRVETFQVDDSAQLKLTDSYIAASFWGLWIGSDSGAQVTLTNCQVSGGRFVGVRVFGDARVTLQDATVSSSEGNGLEIKGSSRLTLINSTVSNNGVDGIFAEDSARVEVRESTIEGNGTDSKCAQEDRRCNGIELSGESKTIIMDSRILANTDWGVVVHLRKCGYGFDDFSGDVYLQGTNTIKDNNKSGNHAGQGNPDGQVCLP